MLKRGFDLLASGIGLVVLSPFLALVAIAVRLDSPGPIFYRATRIGRYGEEFYLYKFRTMVANADRKGPGITVANDRRVTRVGRILRRTKFDEFPQLFNVLLGDMSLVGPRPEDSTLRGLLHARTARGAHRPAGDHESRIRPVPE